MNLAQIFQKRIKRAARLLDRLDWFHLIIFIFSIFFFALFLDDDDEYLDVSDEQDKNKENSDIIEGIIFTFSFSLFFAMNVSRNFDWWVQNLFERSKLFKS